MMAKLNSCVKLSASVRLLVATRQRSLQSQEKDSDINYLESWANQWELETGERVKGIELQNRLHQMQARPSVRYRLKQLIVNEIDTPRNKEDKETFDPERFEFEDPPIGFRNTVFPRVPEHALDILVRRKDGEHKSDEFEKESWVETLGHSVLGLPIITDLKEVVNVEGIKFKPKISYLRSEDKIQAINSEDYDEGVHSCLLCCNSFQNYNNFLFHLTLHKKCGDLYKKETFGQRQASFRLCSELVNECLSQV